MNESFKRHLKLLSVIIILNCLFKAPLLEFDCLSAKLNTSKQEVANASKSAEEILSTLETLVESFDMKEEYVRKKMAEWSGLFERLEGLMTNVTDANETAHDAIDRGEETLKKAKDMLERLKVKFRLRSVAFDQFMIWNGAERLRKA